MTEALRPCPFCGSTQIGISTGVWGDEGTRDWVECRGCGTQQPAVDEDDQEGYRKAFDRWNTRTLPLSDTEEVVERVALKDCPIGLFWSDHELCLKTEYGNNEGRIDAYIVSTGEFFWGNAPQTIASQREQLVRPIDTDAAIASLSQGGNGG